MSDNEEDIKWRELSEAESLEILGYHLDGVNQFLVGFDNHRKFPRSKNTFRFTVKVISFDFIISFSPSSPPPGGALDAISMRYKVYVEYHEVEDEK